MDRAILGPVVALVGWTLVMLLWTVARRLPALKAAKIDLSKARGGRGADLEGRIPAEAQWPAHNYMHLVEQPTLFYAIVLTLALVGAGAMDVLLAWAYVVLRVVHSLWQALVNIVPVRLLLFVLSTAVLMALTLRAAVILFTGA